MGGRERRDRRPASVQNTEQQQKQEWKEKTNSKKLSFDFYTSTKHVHSCTHIYKNMLMNMNTCKKCIHTMHTHGCKTIADVEDNLLVPQRERSFILRLQI